MTTPFEDFLKQHDEESWSATLTALLRSIHEVDRNATQIWFSFYPLSLFLALERSDDRDTLEQWRVKVDDVVDEVAMRVN